jgi:predicted dehydrogenase
MAVESESGIAGTLEMTPYRTTIDWQEQVLVTFEKGWVRLDLPAPLAVNQAGRVTIYRDPGRGETPQTLVPELPHVHSMRQQAGHFVRAVRGESTCLCQPGEALADLRTAKEYIDLWLASQEATEGSRLNR